MKLRNLAKNSAASYAFKEKEVIVKNAPDIRRANIEKYVDKFIPK